MSTVRLEIGPRPSMPDPAAVALADRLRAWATLTPTRVSSRRVYLLDLSLDEAAAVDVLDALTDPVAEESAIGQLPDEEGTVLLEVGLRPGVTDSVGTSVKRAAEDRLGRRLPGQAYSARLYAVEGLPAQQLREVASALVYNPLIERLALSVAGGSEGRQGLSVPRAGSDGVPPVATVPLRGADDATLVRLSTEGMLALSLVEMKAIAAHFAERGRDPTDAELECLAQTWSEHCKHKIFGAPIEVRSASGDAELIEEGIFRRYIRGATEAVAAARSDAALDPVDEPFLVSVFHDNAGVVRFTDADHLVFKVETHNSPSALDPYGGAMTGIVGVNRDSFGTGVGADLLANVWGYCLGDPSDRRPLPAGLMPPRRIRDGVHHGVIDGGNQSGIPYARGWELFDARYLGKPLVFCGTVAVMPATAAGHATHEKRGEVGDAVVMLGGRIGKDGIHGATFSSVELDESAPVQAVQIGDPITQKMMFDMLTEARDRGLIASMTDNGAGGLSSSVGEMAEATGGARIDLAKAPLKYPGLSPWEILISEAQERMTLAVRPEHLEALLALAAEREVEATVLGEFTDNGRFEVVYGETVVADLPLSFLHDGLPRVRLVARPDYAAVSAPSPAAVADAAADPAQLLQTLLSRPGLVSAEAWARHYDHEVKGLSVIKPLVGVRADVPATATVMRARHGRSEGMVLGEGVLPFYADLDAHAMAHACVDEAVRRVLCAGARLDRIAALDNFCWPDPVQSDKTPDGHHKLAQLVECCRGLREACEAHGLPLISGKDSMKNDAMLGGVKISIPPTLLLSVLGQLPDVSRALTLTPRTVGDELWLLGETREELGGSEAARATSLSWPSVPKTDARERAASYAGFESLRDAGVVRSAHVVSRGGLGVALSHLVLASELGLEVSLDGMKGVSPFAALWSESTGRILFTAAPGDAQAVAALGTATRIGAVTEASALRITWDRAERLALSLAGLRAAFSGDPRA
ncbi:MAG: AIR synthase-related protein [Myxococcota bacterium]